MALREVVVAVNFGSAGPRAYRWPCDWGAWEFACDLAQMGSISIVSTDPDDSPVGEMFPGEPDSAAID